MKRQNLNNKDFDQIGSRLLKVTKPSTDEIEQIVANPQMFDSIQMRIKADEQLSVQPNHGFVNWSWLKLSSLNRQAAISAVAILVVFMIFTVLIFVNDKESMQIAEEKKIVKPKAKLELTKAENFLNYSETEIEKDFEPRKSESDKQVISKKKIKKTSKRIRKTNSAKPQYASAKSSVKPKRVKPKNIVKKESPQVAKKEPNKIFYSLPFAENSENGNGNLQIVSTKLSRSELFALGVNLQLENENSTVETELIVGDDGVARAIRVVEKY